MMKTVTLTKDQLAILSEFGQQRDVAVARFEGAARMLIPSGAQPHQLDTRTGTLTYYASEEADVADPD
jgi:hypothetical protein